MNIEDIDVKNIIHELTDDGYFVYNKTMSVICLMDEFKLSAEDSIKLINLIENNFDYSFMREENMLEDKPIAEFGQLSNTDGTIYCLYRDKIVRHFHYEAPLDYVVRTGKLHCYSKQGLITVNMATNAWVELREYAGHKMHFPVMSEREDYEDSLWTYTECRFKKAILD